MTWNEMLERCENEKDATEGYIEGYEYEEFGEKADISVYQHLYGIRHSIDIIVKHINNGEE